MFTYKEAIEHVGWGDRMLRTSWEDQDAHIEGLNGEIKQRLPDGEFTEYNPTKADKLAVDWVMVAGAY